MVEIITDSDIRQMERRVWRVQFVAACLYALGLAPLRRWYEQRHLTELTVIGGVLLSLFPAYWLARETPTTWRLYERRVRRGFVTAAIPITVWQVWLLVRRLLRGGRDGGE